MNAAVASGIARKDIFVTSKIPCCPGKNFANSSAGALCKIVYGTPKHSIEHDFEMLQLDYIDLMLVHWPCDDFEDSVKTYKAMEPYVRSGKIKAIGVSNFNASALEMLLPRVSVKPVVNQAAFSIAGHTEDLWGRDDATRTACAAHGVTYSAYSPDYNAYSGIRAASSAPTLPPGWEQVQCCS